MSFPNPGTLSLEDTPAVSVCAMEGVDTSPAQGLVGSRVFEPGNEHPSDPASLSTTAALDALALACASHSADQDHPGLATTVSPRRANSKGSPKSSKKVSSKDPAAKDLLICNIKEHDVLCGRGGLTNHHPGNVFFRQLVRKHQGVYLKASKRDKAGVAKDIVDQIRVHEGRFLKKTPQGEYVDIGDRKAREKTSQALREGAPELRHELKKDPTSTTTLSSDMTITDDHKFELPSVEHSNLLNSNRARVVSDDSVLGVTPLFRSLLTSALSAESSPMNHSLRKSMMMNGPNQPHFVVEPATSNRMVGSKRKLMEDCASSSLRSVDSMASTSTTISSDSIRMEMEEEQPVTPSSKPGGPRLKLFKSRLLADPAQS